MRTLLIILFCFLISVTNGQVKTYVLTQTGQARFDTARVLRTDSVGNTGYTSLYQHNKTKDSLQANINAKGTGTVSSVAKGFGQKADGTITTSGTIAVDSAVISTVAALTTAKDNLQNQVNTNTTNIALKKNITDSTGNGGYTTLSNRNKLRDSIINLGYITGNQTISFAPTGDVTGSTTGTTTLAPALAIGAGKVTNTMLAGSIDAAKINTGVVSNTEFNYLDGVTSAIQTQLNTKGTGNGDALTTNPLSQFAATTSAQLLGVISDETGSGLSVFATAPTFTTSITDPLIIGGTGATSKITYQSTTGTGTTTAIAHQFIGGTNGATVAATILNNGNIGIGTTAASLAPTAPLSFGSASGVAKIFLYDGGATARYGFGIQGGNGYMQSFVPSGSGVAGWTWNAGGDLQTTGTLEMMRLITGSKLGIATSADPNSNLQVAGSFATAYVGKTTTYTLTGTDHTVECTGGGTFQVTLPTAVGITGREYYIVNSGVGTVTIGTTSSQVFVNVTATPTSITIVGLGAAIVVSNNVGWLQIK